MLIESGIECRREVIRELEKECKANNKCNEDEKEVEDVGFGCGRGGFVVGVIW